MGTLSPAPATLKLKFFTGTKAPTADDDGGVETVLDLTEAVEMEISTISDDQDILIQLICLSV